MINTPCELLYLVFAGNGNPIRNKNKRIISIRTINHNNYAAADDDEEGGDDGDDDDDDADDDKQL